MDPEPRRRKAWSFIAALVGGIALGAASVGFRDSRRARIAAGPALHTEGNGVCSPRLWVLLTSQRSGSTFFCQVLNFQPGLAVGVPSAKSPSGTREEMLIGYSYSYPSPTVTWEEWRGAAGQAFDAVKRAGCDADAGIKAVGFKIMYNQIPPHLFPRVLAWLSASKVAVVHLVREAAVLRLASHAQSAVDHSANATYVNAHVTHPMTWRDPSRVVDAVRRIEEENDWWRSRLSLAPLKLAYHYVAYESLVSAGRAAAAADVVRFVGVDADDDPFANLPETGGLLALHERACGDRVDRWDEIAPLLNGTRCAAACALLANVTLPGLPPPEKVDGYVW